LINFDNDLLCKQMRKHREAEADIGWNISYVIMT
jgi:hypothetical protein